MKMTILWPFSYNFFVKFHAKKNWEPQDDQVISKSMFQRHGKKFEIPQILNF